MNAAIVFRRTGALALALTALLPLSVLADDATTLSRVESRLRKAGVDREPDVRASVQEGTVVLEGAVTTVAARNAAERAAGKESKTVVNRLRVVPDVERSDVEIRKAAAKVILGYVHYGVFDSVGIGVENGIVTLTGSVYQPYHKSDLEARLARVPGVVAIRSDVSVQSNSFFDEGLRRQIARQVYGSDRFTNLNRVNPPVRIIVDRGRVTLTGYVNSEVERVMLGHIAGGTSAFAVDNQVKLDREANPEDHKPAAGAEI